ncbi:hypothetical protein FSP39_010230 [Pinctada imbricata]|uniref:GAS2-like protein 1 n=1 Tax=Pinctada imbricata TaxID=66713 RepID=A0AA88XJU1_PINIB|nr:hypothetical protein FSP39_010230 [Pinctada imbricata]
MESPGTAPSSTMLVLQLKSLVAFKSQDEYLYAMKEDLADWFMCLYQLDITVDNFFEILETGVILCEHANNVRNYANEQRRLGKFAVIQSNFVRGIEVPKYEVSFRAGVKPQTFQARDNVSNFISWTKNLGIPEVLTFETDDLVLRKNEKSVVLCLLEIARVGAKLGMLAPTLVRMEEEIDAEIESGEPPPQIITCDLKSLDEMVKWLAGRCTCPVQFPIIKVGEGKYKIGDSQTLVFVRILRNHVMIRVGGGWDTLEHYLDKHDPCRCGFTGHRQTGGINKTPTRRASTPAVSNSLPTPSKAQRKLSMGPTSHSGGYNTQNNAQRPASPARMRSASPGPSPKTLPSQQVNQNSVTSTNKPPLSPLSPNGTVTNSHILAHRTYSVPSTPRRSQSPVPANRLRSPSPVSATSRSFVSQQKESLQARLSRPESPAKRASSPTQGRCFSPSPARGCVSPSPYSSCASPGPSRRTKILSTPRSKSTTPQIERRQLPTRPSMDSSGNDSEGTDVTSGSGSGQPPVDMNQISTMTLDEFKNLLNSALSVPNGNMSEGSQESPRSQGSSDGFRTSTVSNRMGNKKPVKSSKYGINSGISRSLDSKASDKSKSTAPNGYFEMEKPQVRRTILASNAGQRPKTPVSTVSRPKTPVSSRPKTPVSTLQTNRPKTPVSTLQTNRPKTPVSVSRPKTPVSLARPTTPVDSSKHKLSVSNNSNIKPVSRPIGNSDTSQTYSNSLSYSRTVSNVRDSKPEQTVNICDKKQDSDKPNVAYVCINAEESESSPMSRVSTFHQSQTSNSSLSNSDDRATNSLHRSYTDPGTGLGDNVNEKKSEPSGSSDSLIQSFNALQRSIAELRNRAQQACIASDSVKERANAAKSSNISSEASSRSTSSNDVSAGVNRLNNNNTSLVQTKEKECTPVSILKRSQTVDECSFKTDSEITTPVRRPSQGSDGSTSSNTRRPSTPVGRPATPTGRPSTPSLIPRPMTPVGSVSKTTTSIQPPVQSQTEPTRSGAGRPPTPKKATILAKSPSARNTAQSTDNSYKSIYQNRRSTTPGPNEFRSMSLQERENPVPRRSVTPGPETRASTFTPSSKLSGTYQRSNTLNNGIDKNKLVSESDTSFIERNRARAASASPMIQRKPPAQSSRTLSRQKNVEENITVTVDRGSGKHSISVKDSEDTKYKSERPAARVIARAPTPTQRKSVDHTVQNTRGRSISFESQGSRPRPRSVDPEHWNKGKEEGVVLVVKRTDGGGHKVQDRTEAWVESAAKTVASRTSSNNRKIPPKLIRSKTPNPNDIYEKELQSRSLSEIKEALSLPINGLKEVNTEDLEAPPEDPEMYAKMELLFQKMRERELKASVNETPGDGLMLDLDVEGIENEDESSLDSNENIKRKNSAPRGISPASSAKASLSSVPSTPPRSKTPSMSRSSSSSQPLSRPVSTPPRPSTPTRSSVTSSRRSSVRSGGDSVPPQSPSSAPQKLNETPATPQSPGSSSVDHAVVLVSKIKEILNPKPRKDEKTGPKSRIPAPKSLAAAGKSRSFSNLTAHTNNDWSIKRHVTVDHNHVNGSPQYDDDCEDYDVGDEISGITSRGGSSYSSGNSRNQSGSKTPVPKLATPLTTGRKAVLNRDCNDKSSKLVRAVSISSLSSSSNTMSCPTQDEEEFV